MREKCRACAGSGWYDATDKNGNGIPCVACNGTGYEDGESEEIAELKKALQLACEELDTHCPADLKTGDEGVCKELECDDDTAKCWKEYFLLKARAKHD